MPLYAHEGAWYGSVSDAVHYVKLHSRSHGAVIRVYDDAGNVIENARTRRRFQRVLSITRLKQKAATRQAELRKLQEIKRKRLWVRPPPGALPIEIFALAKISLGKRFDSNQQIFFARDAGDLVAQLAVLEKKQSRNCPDIVLERKALIFVHVNLRYFDRVQFFASDLIQQRRDHFAGATPFGPKIDDHRLVMLRHFAVKIGFIEIDNMGIVHGFNKDKSKFE